jgi:hypothetical protein
MGIRVLSKQIKNARRSRAINVARTPTWRASSAIRNSRRREVDELRLRTHRYSVRLVRIMNGLEIPSIPRRSGILNDGASTTRTVSTLPVEVADIAPGSLSASRNESPTEVSPIWYWVTRPHALPNLRRARVSSGRARRATRRGAEEPPSEKSRVVAESPFPIRGRAGTESRETRVKTGRQDTSYR